jgi:O-antigen ligase
MVVALYSAFALLTGGGGSPAPTSELILQLGAACAAIAWLFLGTSQTNLRPPRAAWLLAALLLAVPLLQLVPLPPTVWQSLPGRPPEIEALRLIGAQDAWMPWSMTPSATLASLLALVPPVLALLMAASLNADDRNWVLAAIAAMTLASVLLGTLQLAAGASGAWRLYGAENSGYLNGFQANRNAQADVLLIGMLATAALTTTLRKSGFGAAGPTGAGLVLLTAIACLLTGSRVGIVMLPFALLAAVLIWDMALPHWRRMIAAASSLLAAVAIAAFMLRDNAVLARVARRFGQERDFRLELWRDTRDAIDAHWPVGSGMGSFRPVFMASERLDTVDPTMPVRAHNDYLEFLLEAGLAGLVVLALSIGTIMFLLVGAWQLRDGRNRAQVLFAGATLTIVALHSFFDYPLRSMALAHVAAIVAGFLAIAAAGSGQNSEEYLRT